MTSGVPQEDRARGRIIVITGPSGVGKDTVIRELFTLDPSLSYCVSYATRAPRPGEVNGVAYWFISEAEFRAMIDRGEFFEWSTVYGEFKGRTFAGIEHALESGADTVVKIDVQGAEKLRRRLGDRAVCIYLLPPNLDELRQRLSDRGTDSGDALRVRQETAAMELAAKDAYDHQVINDDARTAALQILDIIRREPASGGAADD